VRETQQIGGSFAETIYETLRGSAAAGTTARAGIENVQFKVTVETPMLFDYRRTHLLSLIDSVRGKLIANGVLREAGSTAPL
jgi:hypothetical protein